jgi:hypothetical protein
LTFAEGAHTLSITATDAAGNVSSERVRSFTQDYTAPIQARIATPGALSSQTNPTTVAGVAEAFATVRLMVMDDATGRFILRATTLVDAAGNWSLSYNFEPGSRRIKAGTTDRAGNAGPVSPERSFNVS